MTIRYGSLSTHPPTRCGLATFNLPRRLTGPSLVVLHTAPAHPTPGQKSLRERTGPAEPTLPWPALARRYHALAKTLAARRARPVAGVRS